MPRPARHSRRRQGPSDRTHHLRYATSIASGCAEPPGGNETSVTIDSRRKADIRAFAKANGMKYTAALRALDSGFRYPMDRAARQFYEQDSRYASEGRANREAFKRTIEFVTDPMTTPEELHARLIRGSRDIDVHDTAALRPDLLPETMYFLVKRGLTGDGPLRIARNPLTDRRTLSLLVREVSAGHEVSLAIVAHPNTDDTLLRRLAHVRGRPEVREAARQEIARRAAS